MKVKLKNGSEVDLHDDDIKMISEMYKGNFDAEKLEHYFKDMLSKSETNMCMIGGIQNTLNSVIGCAGVRVCPCSNTPVSGTLSF